jgi:hypothetical protein
MLTIGVPPYVVEHLRGAMANYQIGHMSGADNNIEKLTGPRSMTVGEFVRAHLDKLNPKKMALCCFLWITQFVRFSNVIALRYACSRSNPFLQLLRKS